MKILTGSALVLVGLVACSVAFNCSREAPVPDRTKKLYSQNDEELVIRDFFDDRKGGFFVDVGSYHWEELSTTYFLEKHLAWSGIAIDALDVFAEGYAEHRPKTKLFNYAVSDKSGETLKLHLAFGASSVDPEWHKKFPKLKDKPLETVAVPTITLNDLLEQNGVAKIDFLSIDIEGAEPAALAGFDIEKYKPQLVCVEVGEETRARIAAYFEQHGYERIVDERDTVNWYFTLKTPREEKGPEQAE
jgi:FkbM family methyltransferase